MDRIRASVTSPTELVQPPQLDTAAIDRALGQLAAGEKAWAATGLRRRIALLREVHEAGARQAEAWVAAAASYKGVELDAPQIGEEWLSGPYPVLTGTDLLSESLEKLAAGGSPVDGHPISDAPGGRKAVQVLPSSVFDSLLLNGYSVEVWMPPEVTEETIRSRAGLAARTPDATDGIVAVLGAGNITSIPALDVLYELFAQNRVVALKLNPITDAMLPVFESVFAPLIDLGVLRILTGGAEAGQYLVHHEQVAHVHITGSAATHDAIVWGTGEDAAARRAQNTPLLDKPITSELGGVSPIIVLPGRWSRADLRFQAENIATQRLHNGGYNCIASQVVILPSDWALKDTFVAEIADALDRAPKRPSYYPGSDRRVAAAKAAYPTARILGPAGRRLLVADAVSDAAGPADALSTEYFAPVLAIVELPGRGTDYLGAAVAMANDRLTGTLGANVIAHPRTLRRLGPAFEKALVDLRYGTIAVNTWTGLGFLTAGASWGAFPGNTIRNVGSGIGVVHNALLLDAPERTIARGPFQPAHRALSNGQFAVAPRPPWFLNNRTGTATSRLLTQFAANPSWGKLPAIFASALRG
ncbi:aldehyde dehydrogenase family protein [Parafrigoribacterium mesophilum]|uniref:aldehyde dehydrogenase family protein n=1 Tax=Parafrigoribacterium mesophilum TaxID=433646 RepID=UPI0031FD81DF